MTLALEDINDQTESCYSRSIRYVWASLLAKLFAGQKRMFLPLHGVMIAMVASNQK